MVKGIALPGYKLSKADITKNLGEVAIGQKRFLNCASGVLASFRVEERHLGLPRSCLVVAWKVRIEVLTCQPASGEKRYQ